jgi:hypothetical protein
MIVNQSESRALCNRIRELWVGAARAWPDRADGTAGAGNHAAARGNDPNIGSVVRGSAPPLIQIVVKFHF